MRTAFMGLTSSGGIAVASTVAARASVPHLFSTDPNAGRRHDLPTARICLPLPACIALMWCGPRLTPVVGLGSERSATLAISGESGDGMPWTGAGNG